MNKIMEKLQQLLDLINAGLTKLGSVLSTLLVNIINKLTPSNLKRLEQRLTEYVHKRQELKRKGIKTEPILKKLLNKAKEQLPIYKDKLTKKINSLLNFFKQINIKQLMERIGPYLKSKIMPILYKLKEKYEALSPKTIVFAIAIGAILFIASLNFYMATKDIIEKTVPPEEIPVVKVTPRPKYYKAQEKQIRFREMKMPVYVESAKDIHSLIMDFTMESSNRYIKKFFDKNPHYLRDRLNSTVEPIIPTFPLQEEGKKIIKEKLRNESNQLIKEFKIQGEIDKVYLHSIMAS